MADDPWTTVPILFDANPAPTVGTDIGAERAVLGAMMMDASVIPLVAGQLQTADFYSPLNGDLFSVLVSRSSRGEPTDELSMASALADLPGGAGHASMLAKIGGASYLHTLMSTVFAADNATYYADIVRKKAVRRRMDEVAVTISQLARTGTNEPDELADRAIHLIRSTGTSRSARGVNFRDGFLRAKQYMDEVADGACVSTGFPDLEDLIGTSRAGQVIVIAGRPGSGKTALAGSIARNISIRQGIGTLYATLEMSVEEMTLRHISAEASISYNKLRDRTLNDHEMDHLEMVGARLGASPMITVEAPRLSVLEFISEFHRANTEIPIGAAILDYLQLMQTNGKLPSRQEQVAELSRDVKVAARECGIPFFMLAQLNRANEARADKRPQLSDLRESGAVEQDADVVIMVHRPDYYDEYDRPGEADLMVVKNRHGRTGTVVVASQLEYMRFMSMAIPR